METAPEDVVALAEGIDVLVEAILAMIQEKSARSPIFLLAHSVLCSYWLICMKKHMHIMTTIHICSIEAKHLATVANAALRIPIAPERLQAASMCSRCSKWVVDMRMFL